MYFTGNALILPLNIHASRVPDLKRPDCLMTELSVPVEGIVDFRVRTEGGECGLRRMSPLDRLRLPCSPRSFSGSA
jgi:hypothetical protein